MPRVELVGGLMAAGAAVAFGTLGVLGKLSYSLGIDVQQLLALRFLLAAAGMHVLAQLAGQSPTRLGRRTLLTLVAMGAIGYAGQSLTYFVALKSIPASLASLILFIYPSLVAVGAWRLYGRPIGPRHVAALVGSFVGVALLLGGAHLVLSPAIALALTAAFMYAAYLLVGDRVLVGLPPLGASAVTMSGTAFTFTLLALGSGQLRPPPSLAGWAVVLTIAVVPSMLAITLLLAALPRIGGGRTAILGALEPVVTVLLAIAVLGDRLSELQIAGGILVLAAVVFVQWPATRRAAETVVPR
jgi:drug/metabolite transporter (DMT)-like permease